MKLKRIFAMIGVILLALMYLSTLIFSLMKGEMAVSLFKASVYCTLIIPIFLYMYGMFYRYFQNKGEEMREEMKQAQARDPEKSEEDL
ncbi:MAG: hypothetical protein MRZ59_08680 [Clostridiales bacterium]|nr:hypothetical protein [Clostridiales bacterium]MDY3745356.1 hypothetical protein [Lachnospiraceae bacterium]